jgi:cyclohexanone monooxygenase
MPLPAPTQPFGEVDEDEARRRYEAAWAQGGVMCLQQFSDLLTNPESNEFAAEFFHKKVRSIVEDPALAEKLVAKGYPIAAKRPVLDTNYYETFNEPHVHLVDVNESPISEITPTGIRAGDVDHELDVIIFATGYDAFTGSFLRMDVRGRDGVRLADRWADGPTAYLGLGIAGFPNLLTVNGPCNPAVLTNVPATIEHDVEWIADCIAYLDEHGHATIEASLDAQDAWVDFVNTVAGLTLFPTCNSWYLGANVPGKTRVFMPLPGFPTYVGECDKVAEEGYSGFVLAG